MLASRWEDVTPPALPESHPRTLSIYGYVCGARLFADRPAHVPGVGDVVVRKVTLLRLVYHVKSARLSDFGMHEQRYLVEL